MNGRERSSGDPSQITLRAYDLIQLDVGGETPRSRLHSHRASEGDPARQPTAVSPLSMVCRRRSDNCATFAAAAASSASVARNARSSRE